MHLYMLTRGMKNHVDQFITELQGKYLPFKFEGKDSVVQLSVRPIQLWEVVFPKEHKDLILTTCLGGKEGMKGITNKRRHRPFVAMIRKALGIQKLPDYDDTQTLPITRQHMELVGIGIKEDRDLDDGTEGL